MFHPLHLCVILSVILCISAANDYCNDDNLNPVARDNLKRVLNGKKAQYDCKLEYEVAEDISFYNRYGFGDPKDVKKILKFVKRMETGYKVKYFTSKQEMYGYIKRVKGRVGCAHLLHICSHLLHDYRRHICLIDQPSHWWSFLKL